MQSSLNISEPEIPQTDGEGAVVAEQLDHMRDLMQDTLSTVSGRLLVGKSEMSTPSALVATVLVKETPQGTLYSCWINMDGRLLRTYEVYPERLPDSRTQRVN